VVDAVRDAYRARWGDPARSARFEIGDLVIEVLKWEARDHPEQVTLYATVGTSARPLAGRSPAHRLEFFLGMLPARDEIASAFAALGAYPVRENAVIGHGHTIPAGGPLWPTSPMSTFLVVRSRPGFLPPLDTGDAHVDFLQAIPIFESERAFKVKHGVEALLDRWEKAGVPFWDPGRSANPS
jgi:hypothetical protein